MVLFIGLNHNFSLEKDFNLKIGEKKEFENYSVKFNNLQLEEFENYKAVIGEFEINNVAFSQYAKSEIDYIKLWNLCLKSQRTL